jgi:hypothetical protein
VEQVAAAGVQLQAVETRLLHAQTGLHDLVDDHFYLRDGEGPRDVVVEVARGVEFNRRGADGRPLEHRGSTEAHGRLPGTVVPELHEGGAVVHVDGLREFLQPGKVLIVVHTVALVPAGAVGVVDVRRLDDEQAHPAARQGAIVGFGLLAHVGVVLVPVAHGGRALDDAVAGGDRPYAAGLQQSLVAVHNGAPPEQV